VNVSRCHRAGRWKLIIWSPLNRAGAKVIEGPVGRQKSASSVYVRDPDGNLLEFMIYS
jgi:catechol 2,3-dioxygenase-like lactoylglutathione lyase family enzyme